MDIHLEYYYPENIDHKIAISHVMKNTKHKALSKLVPQSVTFKSPVYNNNI
jgi:hypothetical protein